MNFTSCFYSYSSPCCLNSANSTISKFHSDLHYLMSVPIGYYGLVSPLSNSLLHSRRILIQQFGGGSTKLPQYLFTSPYITCSEFIGTNLAMKLFCESTFFVTFVEMKVF